MEAPLAKRPRPGASVNNVAGVAGVTGVAVVEPGRPCVDGDGTGASGSEGQQLCPSALLCLPREVLEGVLRRLDACSLLSVSLCCRAFRAFEADGAVARRLVDKVAERGVLDAAGETCARWRRRSWMARLYIEECGVGFDKFRWSPAAAAAAAPASPADCVSPASTGGTATPTAAAAATPTPAPAPPASMPPQYRFQRPLTPGSFLHIKLEGMGPKLLVSDRSTADQPVLRWRLAVRGNTAVEFGVVPLNMLEDDKALHKCLQEEKKFERVTQPLRDEERPTGFCSSITVGSMLPFKTAIMRGSVVELLARRGRLEVLVHNPPDGQELYWHNTRTVPKPYKGPAEVRFELDFSPHHHVRLALTSWAHGAFDVLHPAPHSRLLGRELQGAWHLTPRLLGSGSGCGTSSGNGSGQQRDRGHNGSGGGALVPQQLFVVVLGQLGQVAANTPPAAALTDDDAEAAAHEAASPAAEQLQTLAAAAVEESRRQQEQQQQQQQHDEEEAAAPSPVPHCRPLGLQQDCDASATTAAAGNVPAPQQRQQQQQVMARSRRPAPASAASGESSGGGSSTSGQRRTRARR